MRYPSRLTFAVAAAILTACAPLKVHYKEGELVARMNSDLTDCKVSALAKVPKDIRTRYIPPTYSPYQYCNGYGNCYWRQRIISPGRYVKYDANDSLRDAVTNQCMAKQGYALVDIPACDPSITQSVPLHATRVMPPLGTKSCAIRLKSGRWQIVTPQG